MKDKEQTPKESTFEVQLHHALKAYGFVPPSSVKDIEGFEKIYGTTKIELPKTLENPEQFLPPEDYTDFSADFKFPLNIAALTSKDSVDLSSLLSEGDDGPPSKNKSKRRRPKE